MKKRFVVALDLGTTSCRAILFDAKGRMTAMEQEEFTQHFPASGWVEHDAEEIWEKQWLVFQRLLENEKVQAEEIAAIGITNQRETTLLWDVETGKPIHRALVWQDKRTADYCEELKKAGHEALIKQKTGLVIDSYFSATKIRWLLDHVEEATPLLAKGTLRFGTLDTWLIWKLTQGKVHATDATNASRTLLMNLETLDWDIELLQLFAIDKSLLPEIKACDDHFGQVEVNGASIPISGVAGDQQAALFGQACFEPGMAKNTYGTGCFMLMNIGDAPKASENGLLTTLAWKTKFFTHYALEGSIFIAGAAIQWLRDGLKIIDAAPDSEYFAAKAGDAHGVYVVPAFNGLGAPYWDQYARGAIFGLSRDTGKSHIIKATLESLAYQTKDVLEAMQTDSDLELKHLRVDGGASANDLLMQFQADILNVEVERPEVIESTAKGAAYLAGLSCGFWKLSDIIENQRIEQAFMPALDDATIKTLYGGWKKAVSRTMGWLKEA